MGLGLGSYVDARRTRRSGGVSYLAFLAPGLLVATCMQTASFEATFPIMAGLVWSRVYPRDVRDADPWQRHRARATSPGSASGCCWSRSIFTVVIVLFGAATSPLIVLAIPVAALTGLAFAAPIAAFAATQRTPEKFAAIFRFGITPLFLFSGTFYPVESLPAVVQPLAWLTPLYHGVVLARGLSLGTIGVAPTCPWRSSTWRSSSASSWSGRSSRSGLITREAGARMTAFPLTSGLLIGSRRSLRLVERNLFVYKHGWLVLLSGFFEPLFYLLSIGFGLGALVGTVPGRAASRSRTSSSWRPALLASAAMNGAIMREHLQLLLQAQLQQDVHRRSSSTPLSPGDVAVGELTWALIRGGLYAIGFMAVMVVLGLVVSPWVVLARAGRAAGRLRVRGRRDGGDVVHEDVAGLRPHPARRSCRCSCSRRRSTRSRRTPRRSRSIVRLTPLYQGVDLIRSLTVGAISPILLFHVAYLLVMGFAGLFVVSRRLDKLLLQ